MIYRTLTIGRWFVEFFFAVDGYDTDEILSVIEELGGSDHILRKTERLMRAGRDNTGFTFTNQDRRRALVVIGPSSSGREFIDTFVHEVHHLAVAVASSLGIDLESETPAYMSGDSARELADLVCELGCSRCHSE